MLKNFILTNSKSYAKFKQLKAIFFLNEQPKCQAMDYNQVKHVLKLFFCISYQPKTVYSVKYRTIRGQYNFRRDGQLGAYNANCLFVAYTHDLRSLCFISFTLHYPIGELIKRSFYVWVYKLHIKQKTLVKTIQCFQINIKVFLNFFCISIIRPR